MVAQEVFDLLDRLGPTSYIGLEDFADKLNFLYTVIILLVCTVIISVKSYVFKAISCFISTTPSGANFEDYVENYCWVHGTVPFYGQNIPNRNPAWDAKKDESTMFYYQWVPFILGLMTILFYMPRILWQLFCFSRGGRDLEQIVRQSVETGSAPFGERQAQYEDIGQAVMGSLYLHRDFRQGRRAHWQRRLFSRLPWLLASKRLGTRLAVSYLGIKLLYFANALGQLFLLQSFLGYSKSLSGFGWQVLTLIRSGSDHWHKDGPGNNYFPRVVFCNVPDIEHTGGRNRYTAQCVLPTNMLNQMVFVFLWFWLVLVATVTLVSVPLWLWRVFGGGSSVTLVRTFLRMHNVYDERRQRANLQQFVTEFLRPDGIFLLRMIAGNAGDVICSHVTRQLWTEYLEKYQQCNLRRDYEQQPMPQELRGGEPVDNEHSMAINLTNVKYASVNDGIGSHSQSNKPSSPSADLSNLPMPMPHFL